MIVDWLQSIIFDEVQSEGYAREILELLTFAP